MSTLSSNGENLVIGSAATRAVNQRISQSSNDGCDSGYEGSVLEDENRVCSATIGPVSSPTELADLIYAKREFCRCRKVILKNIPAVTYETIKEFLDGYDVVDISISKKCRHAIVSLRDGAKAEEIVSKKNGELITDTEIDVSLHPSDNLLCVAHLPFNMNDEDFRLMVEPYGELERCFLMRSADGSNKGYGLVEYVHNKEKSANVRQMLDGKKLGSCILHCDFIDTCVTSFNDLHSRCLFIDHLPPGFKDGMTLRDICSSISDPVYCQLAVRCEQALGFAVVEYTSPREAEASQKRIHGHVLRDHSIRATFCVPGQRASDVYNRLMTAVSNGILGRPGLLPVPSVPPQSILGPPPMLLPVSGTVDANCLLHPFVHLYLTRNPAVIHGFQSILKSLYLFMSAQEAKARPGLLGRGPGAPPSPLLNSHLQMSLIAVMMTAYVQANMPNMVRTVMDAHAGLNRSGASGRPPLLGNPLIAQAEALLNTLTTEISSATGLAPAVAEYSNGVYHSRGLSRQESLFIRGFTRNPRDYLANLITTLRHNVSPRLTARPTSPLSTLIAQLAEHGESSRSNDVAPANESKFIWTQVNPVVAQVLQHYLIQTIQRQGGSLAPPARSVHQPPCLPRPVPTERLDQASTNLKKMLGVQPPTCRTPPPLRVRTASPRRGLLCDGPEEGLNIRPCSAFSPQRQVPDVEGSSQQQPSRAVAALASPRQLLQFNEDRPVNSPRVRAFIEQRPHIQSMEDLRSTDMAESPLTRELRRRWEKDLVKSSENQQLMFDEDDPPVRKLSEKEEDEAEEAKLFKDINDQLFSTIEQQENASGQFGPAILRNITNVITTLPRTPVTAKKRPSTWLPDPEPSPESDYVGQHSQGIGGHYAMSYKKFKKI